MRYGFQLEGERQAELDEFTNTRNAGVVGEVRNPNLFGRALTGGVFGMYQRDRRDATVFVATSRLFGWRARSTLYGFYSRDRVREMTDDIEIDSITDRAGRQRRSALADQGIPDRLRVPLRAQPHASFPAPRNDPMPFDMVVNLAKLSAAVAVRSPRRSDQLAQGHVQLDLVRSERRCSSARIVSNRKLLMQQFVFVPLGRMVLASRVQAGFAFGRDPLAFTDRFRAGGATSVRGYGEESLGPRDDQRLAERRRSPADPQPGSALPDVSAWRVNGVVFIDAGNIFAKGEDLERLEDRATGLDLRLDTPVGLLRGDVGFPSNRSTSRSRRPCGSTSASATSSTCQ